MEQERLKNTAEIASNIAVVLVAVAVLSFAIAYFWIPPKPKMIAGLEKGQQFSLVPNLDYKGTEQTLLIALNTECSYCQESVPLYRKVMDAYPPGNKSLRIVALFPNKIQGIDYCPPTTKSTVSIALGKIVNRSSVMPN